ncbi:MAG: aminodeoxychorismate lyase [Candidatus Methylumidiphilus sp.]
MAIESQAASPVLVNGVATRNVDAADRGLHYGDGVFTTLPVRLGVPLFLNRHLARLQADAARLGIPFPEHSLLAAEASSLAARHPHSVLKILLTRGVGGRGYRCPTDCAGTRVLSAHPPPDYPETIKKAGARVRLCGLRLGLNPHLAGVKHLNRLEQVLARAEWDDDGIREGLLLDYEGFLVEGVMSNVFVVQGGRLRTPLLDRCGVAGVMRGLVLDLAREMGTAEEVCRLSVEDVFQADEVFLTNSVIGLWPVSQLEDQAFAVGPLTRLLAQGIEAATALELNPR